VTEGNQACCNQLIVIGIRWITTPHILTSIPHNHLQYTTYTLRQTKLHWKYFSVLLFYT